MLLNMRSAVLLAVLFPVTLSAAEKPVTVNVWPGGKAAEDDAAKIGKEHQRFDMKNKDGTPYSIAGKPAKWITDVTQPTLTFYRPDPGMDTGAAVIVCPGGGYWNLAIDLEGEEIAKWLASQGLTGVVLKYRVPRRPGMNERDPNPGSLKDAQRAVSLLRSKAKTYKIDPNRIGMVGFSAGGHLVAATCTNFDKRTYKAIDDVDKTSCRPDFGIVCYPGYTKPDNQDVLATTLRATKDAPPLFIVHAGDDTESPSDQSIVLYLALQRVGAPVELHIYPVGEHGFGVRDLKLPVCTWTDRCVDWMKFNGFLTPSATSTQSKTESK